MNDKKARALRKLAQQQSVGLPKVSYIGIRKKQARRPGITHYLSPQCTRGIYQKLKKLYAAPR